MAEWATFTGITGVVLVLLLVLARASTAALTEGLRAASPSVDSSATESGDETTAESVADSGPGSDETTEGAETRLLDADEIAAIVDERPPSVVGNGQHDDRQVTPEPGDAETTDGPTAESHRSRNEWSHQQPLTELSTSTLLANVALSQALFGVLLVTMAWYTGIPAWAFGLTLDTLTVETIGVGVAVGGVLYGLNEAAATVGRQQGIATPTGLREALAPETATGWAVLLLVVLPIIAGFEELLFRGALIGVIHAGFGISPWLLAGGSSVAFALGHGAQGRLGIVVTGLLGGGLAVVFVLTESLLVVILAHYVVNSLEFIVHEGLELA